MVVLLRNVRDGEQQVPVAICTTDDYPTRAARPFEIKFAKGSYRCFKNDTVIDARAITFVATLPLYNKIEPEDVLSTDDLYDLEFLRSGCARNRDVTRSSRADSGV